MVNGVGVLECLNDGNTIVGNTIKDRKGFLHCVAINGVAFME
jgi:hypothetical protein